MNQYHQPSSGVAPIKLAHITLENLHVDMQIGIAPSEIGKTQRVRFDVKVGVADAKTHIDDSIEGLRQGFDYSKLRNCVVEATKAIEGAHPKLLEPLANRIADAVMVHPEALTCSVKVTKSRPWSDVETVSVEVTR